MTVPDGLIRECVDRIDSEFAIIDSDGTILYTNQAWQDFAIEGGFPRDPAMIGENYLDAARRVRDDDRFADAACEGLDALVSGEKEVFKLEYPCPAPDAPSRWFLLWASPVSFEGETYLTLEHIEITERKRAEQRLEVRNEMLETVSSILSHDIRNPMSAAMGWGQTIQIDETPDPEHVDRLISSLQRMDRMIDDALFLSRGLLVEETEVVSLEEVADRAWNAVGIETATLDIVADVCTEGDPNLLQTLFENLFRNSITHGSETVSIEVGALEYGFYVEDDGPGIPESERNSVFDAGYTTRTIKENTGMGLTIVKGIVDAHEWELDLTESVNGGARFEVCGVKQLED